MKKFLVCSAGSLLFLFPVHAKEKTDLMKVVPATNPKRLPLNCRSEKTSILLPEGAPLPDVWYKSTSPKERALERVYAYSKATHSEALKFENQDKNIASALVYYSASVNAIRDSKYPLDSKFTKQISQDYARCLKKKGDFKKAKLILNEFSVTSSTVKTQD